jgi:transcriptional regulator with XRE-family HTH domain
MKTARARGTPMRGRASKAAAATNDRTGGATWSRPRRAQETIQFGRKLQALRGRRGWSLAAVSKMSGISMATLSRIENNKLSPTLDIVCRLLNGLGVPYHELLIPAGSSTDPGFCLVTERGHAHTINLAGASFEVLSRGNDSSALYAVIVTIDGQHPGETHGLAGHEGEEFLHVLSGRLELHRQGYDHRLLKEGDSVFFDSGVPHDYVAASAAPTRVLIVTNPSASVAIAGRNAKAARPDVLRQSADLKVRQ